MSAHTRAKGIVLLTVVAFALAGIAQAGTTYYVDDDGIADFSTIEDAVNQAVTGDTIVLRPGRYAEAGNWDVIIEGKSITIRSVDPNSAATVAATVIDCRGTDGLGHRAFDVTEDTGVHLTLAGLTLTNGMTLYHGGAVMCPNADITAINCTFSNHTAGWWGGAVFCVNGTATFEGCTFTNGESQDVTGGAVYVGNGIGNFSNCTFRSNVGNAVVGLESRMTLVDCAFEGNVGQDGGALRTYAGKNNPEPYLHMSRCSFIDNTSNTNGGAYHGISARGTIDACTFVSNTAVADGGAMYTRHSSLVVTNCAFLTNITGKLGGAVANSFDTTPSFVNCTFVGNQASAGGAMSSAYNANPLISSCILWSNVAAKGTELYLQRITDGGNYVAQATIEYSDVYNGIQGTKVDSGCTLTWGDGNIDADPLFISASRGDYRLSTDSPCIDAGDPNYIPGADATDLDGQLRKYGSAVDMGAYEYQGLGPVYRFWSPVKERHFYTISGAERDDVIKLYPHIYVYEGVAFYAYYRSSEAGLTPVYRFWSPALESHRWTIDEDEKNALIADKEGGWVYEGIVFYVYPSGRQPLGSLPVYRYWSPTLRQEFYTMGEAEIEYIAKLYPNDWILESIAWYAFADPHQPELTTYAFTGDAEDLWYTLTLKAYVDGKEAQIDQPEVQLIPTSAEMEMTVDYTNSVCTFNSLSVQTGVTQHTGKIVAQAGAQAIPFTLSLSGGFTAVTQRGPFTIDPETGIFADFRDADQSLTAQQATYTYSGSASLGTGKITFSRTSSALQFELQSFGVLEGFAANADTVDAQLPLTFQWSRPAVKDLIAEATVGGQLVQIYVTTTYTGTQGTWKGQAIW